MNFGEVRPDIASLGEIIILLLGGLLFILSLVLIYILVVVKPLYKKADHSYRVGLTILCPPLLVGCALYIAPDFWLDRIFLLVIAGAAVGALILVLSLLDRLPTRLLLFSLFFVLEGFTIYAAWQFAHGRLLGSAIAALVMLGTLTTIYYALFVRPLVRLDDNRVFYTMMLVGGLALFALAALCFLWFARDRISLQSSDPIGPSNLLSVAGFIVSAVGILFTYLMRSEQANRTANQQIYQTLELQSVQLFRFEADHPKLVRELWFTPVRLRPELRMKEEELSSEQNTDIYVLRQYICQMLNLFEMAYRFRARGIMEAEVFSSWVIWMWELCESEVFRVFWRKDDGLGANYVTRFSEAMENGVVLCDIEQSKPARMRKFFEYFAENLDCPEIRTWLAENADRPSDAAKRHLPA
jgi:hypothetical protein